MDSVKKQFIPVYMQIKRTDIGHIELRDTLGNPLIIATKTLTHCMHKLYFQLYQLKWFTISKGFWMAKLCLHPKLYGLVRKSLTFRDTIYYFPKIYKKNAGGKINFALRYILVFKESYNLKGSILLSSTLNFYQTYWSNTFRQTVNFISQLFLVLRSVFKRKVFETNGTVSASKC